MSIFDDPFDPKRRLHTGGCACGRHLSAAEHERDVQLQCAAIETTNDEKRYEGVEIGRAHV